MHGAGTTGSLRMQTVKLRSRRHEPATLRMKNLSVHHSGSLGSFETKMKWKNSRLRGFHRSAA